jgi:hypothetical protein
MTSVGGRQIEKLFRRTTLLLAIGSAALQAQPRVTIADLGPGASGRMLSDALRSSHRLIEPDTSWFVLRRDERVQSSLVVLGRTAAIAGSVDGDVIVVGGDLHLRPGVRVAGKAVAIGGGVYTSVRAITLGGTHSARDNTFEITRTADGYRLEYRSLRLHASPSILLPGIYGLRLPSYDRVNGASVPLGPTLSLPNGRGEVELLATYRSDLGKVDPALSGGVQLSRRLRAHLEAQRGTFTNDAWIWSNFVNSLASLAFGTDTRNYYRADRAELTVHRLWETERIQVEPFLGARTERAWSVGPSVGEQRGPWSIFGKTDTLRMWRPNPSVSDGVISSALAGSSIQWDGAQQVKVRAGTRGEMSLKSPGDERFTQLTSDIEATFPTFGEQEYFLDVHWVTTPGDTPPPQRFSYIGGAGTLAFLELLEHGGDELLLIDQRYSMPLSNISVGLLGVPTVYVRHRMGSAGIGALPPFEQQVGAGVTLTLIRAEIVIDPASGKVRTSVGLSFSR